MKVKTIGPVQHDGKQIKPGTILNLSDDAAAQLIDVGAAEAVDKAAEKTADDTGVDGK
jgi:hypothetical protein